MMSKTTLLSLLLTLGMLSNMVAQDDAPLEKPKKEKSTANKKNAKANSSKIGVATPKDMLELGINGGYFFVAGDVPHETGFGGGIHLRKSLDYIFSIRTDLLFGEAKGENTSAEFSAGHRVYNNQWYSASLLGVISLNAIRFDKPVRKVNYYALVGGGGNSFETKYNRNERQPDQFEFVREREIAPHVTFGAGIAFRLGSRVNISIEHQASSVFGRRADLPGRL